MRAVTMKCKQPQSCSVEESIGGPADDDVLERCDSGGHRHEENSDAHHLHQGQGETLGLVDLQRQAGRWGWTK